MEDVCRLCLQKEENMLYIFSFKDEELCSLIFNCCSIEITKDDALPKLICMECIAKLKAFNEFKERCKIFDSALREHYKVKFNFEDSLSKIKIYQNVHVQTDITNETLQIENSPLSVQAKNISKENDFNTYSNNNDDHIQVDDEFDNLEHLNDTVSSTTGSQDSLKTDTKLKLKIKLTRLETNDRRRSDRLKNKKKVSKCNFCGKEYLSRRAFIEHTKLHIDEKTSKRKDFKLFRCVICGIRFNSKLELHSHMQIHGTIFSKKSKDKYMCNICDKTYRSKNVFYKHLKIGHNETDKQYACQFCDKTFVLISYKKRHEKKHTREKEFACHMCNASFTSYSEFIHHFKVHSGEVNYCCKICNKAFLKKVYLKEHSFMHTGEKRPFVCKVCGSTYKHSSSLYTHNKKCKLQQNLDYITSAQKKDYQ